MGDLKDKVAIVTGAGSGMGRAVALELAERGAVVVALDMNAASVERTMGLLEGSGPHRVAVVDVTVSEAVNEVIAEVRTVLGGVDLLCNAAGIADQGRRTHELTDAEWHRVIAVDLYGPFYLCRACIPSMIERGGGAVVNISSAAGIIGVAGGAAYTSAKHGLLGLTKRLATEYGHDGVRTNAVCPGFVATEMNEGFRDTPWLRDAVESTPSGRWAEPRELAKVVAYLLSDDASYVMGACLVADGGWTII